MKVIAVKIMLMGLLSFFVASSAFSAVIYDFSFSNLSGVKSGSGEVFGITLTFDDYVKTTGMNLISGAPQSTTLGYPVAYAGANSHGWWAFDDDTSSLLDDNGFTFGGLSFLAIFFDTNWSFITSPGVYHGSVHGNAPSSFEGSVLLTVTGPQSHVPEPLSLVLLLLGLTGIALVRKRA